MTYRLALDLGSNSIGWCILDLDAAGNPAGIRDIGVRIFHDSRDPQSGVSLATDRRTARGARRRRDRYLKRRNKLMAALVRHGLMPADAGARKEFEALDPYELRARALAEVLPPYSLGRAIFHLSQRRGFKSNRKTAVTADDAKEDGLVRAGVKELERRIGESGSATLGEFLWRRRRKGKAARARPGVGIYPSRDLVEKEFHAIWDRQTELGAKLTDAARAEIADILLYQRPLHAKDPGFCELEPDDRRAPLALPMAQKFRIFQELNNLRVIRADETERPLKFAERDILLDRLLRQKTVAFGAMHKALKLKNEERFNLETTKRKGLNGDATGVALADKALFGARWRKLTDAEQDAVVETLLAIEDEADLAKTARADWGLDPDAPETAAALAGLSLKPGYGSLGRIALGKLVPVMRDQGLDYAAACAEVGYHHSDRRPKVGDILPYYGKALTGSVAGGAPDGDTDEEKYGTIANPTVHVALNQLRRVANAVIAEHGPPAQIHVETNRELKLGQKKKDEISREQRRNEDRNERVAAELVRLGQTVSGENIRRYKLWEDQGPPNERRCIYSGDMISAARLFAGDIDIDHILPFSRTLDDGNANKLLCTRAANQAKGNRSPFEAFGSVNSGPHEWNAILNRAENLPYPKRRRFAPDAMARFEKENGFIARHLTDTAYIARIARQYLSHVCPASRVRATPGRLTSLLRGKWGLNELLPDHNFSNTAQPKNRLDHRHHAIDAFVVGVTDAGLLQRVATAAEESRDRLIADMPDPYPGFRDDLRDRLAGIVVSHRPDHGVGGQMHEDTAYGLASEAERADGWTLTYRKPLEGLNEKEMERIRDPALRDALAAHVAAEKRVGRTLREAQAGFRWPAGTGRPVRHVRLLKKEARFETFANGGGEPYKALVPGENHHVDIVALPDGKWIGWGVTVFEANRAAAERGSPPPWKREHPAGRLVMRLHKGDSIKMLVDGDERVMRVLRLVPSNNRIELIEHTEAGKYDDRVKDKADPFDLFRKSFSRLHGLKARKVHVDALGRVRDPGPPA